MSDLQPGDLVVLNQAVVVTDCLGIFFGALGGYVLNSNLHWFTRTAMAGLLFSAAYSVINWWA